MHNENDGGLDQQQRRELRVKISELIATGFLSGRAPVAPGTVGSIAACLLWLLLKISGASFATLCIVTGCIILAGWWATEHYVARNSTDKQSDPSEVVIDEWAGMWIALLGVQELGVIEITLAFMLFRLFDISKPWIVGKCDRMHGTKGIMLDDIAAGFIALLCLMVGQSLF